MKKVILSAIIIISLLALAGTTFAAKPDGNLAGAQKVAWNLSAAVMPVPPYGSLDIPGSDIASKLIVNRPNGAVKTTITGAMNGLHPNTTYTVYLSNGYTPYTSESIVGPWTWTVLGTYVHDINITAQNPDGTFSGTGGWPSGGSYQTTETITGQIVGDTVTFTTTYLGPYNPGYTVTVSGTINSDGSISGSSPWGWITSDGAVKPASGSTSWPGLFTSTVQPFTFTTDNTGSGSWHVNLRAGDFPGVGPYKLSVWINEAGGTMLISDSF